ncbi:MAG: serine hydrolase domain-containing protein [Bacteroidia bacterium]
MSIIQYKYSTIRINFVLIVILVVLGCCNESTNSDSDEYSISNKTDSIQGLMSETNAYYLGIILANGRILEYTKGLNSNKESLNSNTIFEAASLSKTITAYVYWKMLLNGQKIQKLQGLECETQDTLAINCHHLLSHSLMSTDSCIHLPDSIKFKYSENNYLLLQRLIESYSSKNLESLASEHVFKPLNMTKSSFIWRDYNNYVNGYYQNFKKHREIRHYSTPKSNGTLYTSGRDMLKFTQELLKSNCLDSMAVEQVKIPGFTQLAWGRGIGIEYQGDKKFLWQWGNNWSYNHILLIDKTSGFTIVCLSNSIIGASKIRTLCNFLMDRQFQLFDYIDWY